MSFYNIIYFCIPLIYGLSIIITQNRNNYIFLAITGIVLVVISAARNIFVGTDTLTYYNIFNWISGYTGSTRMASKQSSVEQGYLFLNRLIFQLHGSFKCLIVIISLITVLSFIWFIKKYSLDYLMSVIIFLGFTYYFMSFNISRQFLAVSIGLLAFCFEILGRKYISLVFVLLACTIHTAAIGILILWVMTKIRTSRKEYLVVLLLGGILALPTVKAINVLFRSNERYAGFITNQANSKSIVGVLLVGVLFLVYILLLRNFNFESAEQKDYLMLYGMTIIVMVDVLDIFFPFMGRIKYVFEPLIITILPYTIVKSGMTKYISIFNIILFILGIVIMNRLIPDNVFYGIIPYGVGLGY